MEAATRATKAVDGGTKSTEAATPPYSSSRTGGPEAVPGQAESSTGNAAAEADPAPATAAATRSKSAAAESGVEDEQVEKFYALLANVRAMKGLHTGGSTSSDAGEEVCGASGGRKRERWAEPPWRPAFRMEDFEEAPAEGSASRKQRRDGASASPRRSGKETTTDEAAGGRAG
ncbi:NRR repressor homolog 1 [Brachypodium distachyon]|uniref:NRR repressor homolog 1 n=1 Tax=Brachypodium distachyon TaxID=15368 RepID=I1HK50_BRADI|nr:NRR repressor homolog 1 [Brachypodium distachyon]KQK06654.1 hypothetical protein BRADI_2g27670v3 [Brachypodium distachyon]|eukprot:XP_014754331.1 NRR repressor homolog 1 [Brachypodium distachyon]